MTLNTSENLKDTWDLSTPHTTYVLVPTKDCCEDDATASTMLADKTAGEGEKEKGSTVDIGKWLMVGGAVVGGAAFVPIYLGFGVSGIVGGSIAAAMQSAIGNVAAGSAFAIAQSLGAQGVFVAASCAGGATTATGAVLKLSGKKEESNEEENGNDDHGECENNPEEKDDAKKDE